MKKRIRKVKKKKKKQNGKARKTSSPISASEVRLALSGYPGLARKTIRKAKRSPKKQRKHRFK